MNVVDRSPAAPRRTGRSPRTIAALLALTIAAVAAPADAKVLVLTFQGPNAAKLQSAVSAALQSAGQEVTAGDTSFDDAAVLIGCDAQSDACAEEVLSTLSVDEVVFGSSTKSGEVVLQRVVRGQPRRQTRARVEPGQSGAGLEAAVAPAVRELYDSPRPSEPRPVSEPAAPSTEPAPSEPEAPRREPTSPVEASLRRDDATPARPYRRWAIITWSGAGVAALGGLMLWINAGSLQDDIDAAPTNNQQDLEELRDLEDRAERSSDWGNAMMVVGAGLAGVGTYLWIKDRRQQRAAPAASTARAPWLQPTLFPGGAGVLVTIGGQR
jgi:hypothetical protein